VLLWSQTVSLPILHAEGKRGEMDYKGLQMLVIEHTTESGEAASEVMNSSPQIQT